MDEIHGGEVKGGEKEQEQFVSLSLFRFYLSLKEIGERERQRWREGREGKKLKKHRQIYVSSYLYSYLSLFLFYFITLICIIINILPLFCSSFISSVISAHILMLWQYCTCLGSC